MSLILEQKYAGEETPTIAYTKRELTENLFYVLWCSAIRLRWFMILGYFIACSLIHERVFPKIKEGHEMYH